ncbi:MULTISPECIES: hypothetical protein [unclassified Mycobacterium]|uniref:hypothetical protein n=1 Tax=unclassified Mycobacterium TaxID=2642494 RepID=UPI0012E3D621|nr:MULTISPECIES: hypothetical protein [unclassified Mycobacterium]
MLPADTFWQQHISPYAVIFSVTLGVIALWLLWRRRGKIKDWSPVQTALDFSPATQKFLLMLFVLGLLLLASLWAIDLGAFGFKLGSLDLGSVRWLQADWLNSHAYIPNILAGVTGFCIGAPFALVILASFTAEREQQGALDRVNRLSALAWDSFRSLVNEFASNERYELIVNQARDIKQYYDETTAAINEYMRSANQVLGTSDDVKLSDNMKQVREIESNFRIAVNALRQNINFFETRDEWAQIVGAWRVLDQYVRLQRLEQGLEWFDKTPDAGFRRWASRETNPLQDLLDAIEIRLYTPNMTLNVDTMANALDTLAWYTRFDNAAHLGEYLLTYGNIFTSEQSSVYHTRRDAAQLFIIDLKRYIGLVELEYWPRAQKVPERESTVYEQTAHEWIGSLQTPEGRKNFERVFLQVVAQQKRERRKRRIKRALWGVSGIDD